MIQLLHIHLFYNVLKYIVQELVSSIAHYSFYKKIAKPDFCIGEKYLVIVHRFWVNNSEDLIEEENLFF